MNPKRVLIGGLIAATPLAAAIPAAAAARPAAAPAPAGTVPTYLGTMLMPHSPMNMETGFIGMISQRGGTTTAVNLEGLQPGASYALRLNVGVCNSNVPGRGVRGTPTPTGLALGTLPADRMGEARAVLALPTSGIATILPRMTSTMMTGLSVTLSRPGMSGMSGASNASNGILACGNVYEPTAVRAIVPPMMMPAGAPSPTSLTGGTLPGATAMIIEPTTVPGVALKSGTLVLVYATGLQKARPGEPGVAQPLHIHAGPCSVPNAPIRYALTDLVGDAQGRALSGTALTDLVPVTGRFSVHIHATNWNMLACGNL